MKWTSFLSHGFVIGVLAFSLGAPVFADTPVDTTSTMTTTVATTDNVLPAPNGYYDSRGDWHNGLCPYSGGYYDPTGAWHTVTTTVTTVTAPSGGYYDQAAVWHVGVSPLNGGWYDSTGIWHEYNTTVTKTVTVSYAPGDIYNSNYINYYAGYGSMVDLTRGYTYVTGVDGAKTMVDLKANRTLVRLTDDNTLEPKLDVERGFDRGLVDVPSSSFDPMRLEIPTGRTVTFFADNGAHTIQPMDGRCSLTQSVIITPGQVFSYTFTQPGLYRFEDSFGGGPTGSHIQGLVIRVKGDAVAWDDSMFADADYVESTQETTAYSETPVVTSLPLVPYNPSVTQTETIQVQGQQTQAPVKKVHKQVLRNQDLK